MVTASADVLLMPCILVVIRCRMALIPVFQPCDLDLNVQKQKFKVLISRKR